MTLPAANESTKLIAKLASFIALLLVPAWAYEPAALQKRMAIASSASQQSNRVGCPHHLKGLVSFAEVLAQTKDKKTPDVTLPVGKKVLFEKSADVGVLTVPAGSELIFADQDDLKLTARSVIVLGALRLGAETCGLQGPVSITLVGEPDGKDFASDPKGSKAIVAAKGGVIDMHGLAFAPTWTRLAKSAEKGTTVISLQDSVDWQVGQTIVVVTTAWKDESDDHQNEERQIKEVRGSEIVLDKPLTFAHYGGPEYAAEVALLSRSITIQGDESSERAKYGGHTMCHRGSICRFFGIRAFKMGQQNVMGRYPFHMHLMGDVKDQSYFKHCAVHHSYFRAFTVHGTHFAQISQNVAYDVAGSAYYLEDGSEENNVYEFNLAAFIHIIKPLHNYEGAGGQKGVTLESEPARIVPTDATAAGFYCTNAKNRWIGNSASGGFSGFVFPALPRVLGGSFETHPLYVPEAQELLEFDSNTAHSSGRLWSRGACMYVGGQLTEKGHGTHKYVYKAGRVQPARQGARFKFRNTKVFLCKKGILFWGAKYTARKPHFMLENFEAHDVERSSQQMGETYMANAVVSAHTDNLAGDKPDRTDGFELYDTDMQTIMANVTFRNFNREGDAAIIDMTHSNIFKQQGMFHAGGLKFESTPRKHYFKHIFRLACKTYHKDTCKGKCSVCPGTAGSSQTSSLQITDGESVGLSNAPSGVILGADDDASETNGETSKWWLLDDSCIHEKEWGFFACPRNQHREVVSLYMVKKIYNSVPKSIFSKRIDPNVLEGHLYHFGKPERKIQLGLAGSPMITGTCCDVGWYMHLKGPALKELTIYLDQMVPQGGLVFATSYPVGARFEIHRCLPDCTLLRKGSSLQDVVDAAGTLFFVDEKGRLYLKLLDETNGFFEAAGIKQLRNGNRWNGMKGIRYLVKSSLSGSVTFDVPPALRSDQPPAPRPKPILPAPTPAPKPKPTPPVPKPTPKPSPSGIPCAKPHKNCLRSRCCDNDGLSPGTFKCFQKDKYYAQCKKTCTVGISSTDPAKFKTPWSCRVLSPTSVPQPSPSPAPTPKPTPIPPAPKPTPKPPSIQCSKPSKNCLRSRCCDNDGFNTGTFKCYEKNEYYAQCKKTCTVGISPTDPAKWRTPWSCKILTPNPVSQPTPAPTPVPTRAPAPILRRRRRLKPVTHRRRRRRTLGKHRRRRRAASARRRRRAARRRRRRSAARSALLSIVAKSSMAKEDPFEDTFVLPDSVGIID